MDNSDPRYALAKDLMKIFPGMGRQISMHLRKSGEEETTMMQVNALHHLKEHSISASDLAKLRKVSLQSASVLVQSLVDRGWVVRTPDPVDRRRSLLEVTPEGVAKTEATFDQISSYIAEFLADLSPEEIAAAQIFLPALNRILAQHMATDIDVPIDDATIDDDEDDENDENKNDKNDV